MQKKINIGTRGSTLALIQAHIVLEKLKILYPDIKFEIKKIKTSGDKLKHVSILNEPYKNFFVKEIETALLKKRVDIAVHSMKDLSFEMPAGLCIGSVLEREKPNDVLVSLNGKKLMELEPNSVIGTSSLRRKIQILEKRKDLTIKEIRGNIETRIKKIGKEFDAVIIAYAALKRLNKTDLISENFELDDFLPAPAQGAICVQCRKNDKEIMEILNKINCEKTNLCVSVEREFSRILAGDCKTPIGTFAFLNNDNITFHAMYYSNNKVLRETLKSSKNDALNCAANLAKKFKEKINV